MDVSETIEKAAEKVGSQRKLSELLGLPEQHLSGFKKGRPISYQRHAQIAAVAGMREQAVRILIEGMASGLSDDVEHEALIKGALDQVEKGVLAVLGSMPIDHESEEEMKVHTKSMKVNIRSRHRRRLLRFKELAQHRVTPGVFFACSLISDAAHDDQRHIKVPCRGSLCPPLRQHAQNFRLLLIAKLFGPAKDTPAFDGRNLTCNRSLTDDAPFELGHRTEDLDHENAQRPCCVQRFGEGAHRSLRCLDAVQDHQKVKQRARNTIHFVDNKGISRLQ